MFTLAQPNGFSIKRWEDWTPPKSPTHWVPGRSSMELAKAWFRNGPGIPSAPDEMMNLFTSERRFKELELMRGIPEYRTSLKCSGNGRNHDLWLIGRTGCEQVTICVEAKADESFGNYLVGGYWTWAMQRRIMGIETGVPERIEELLSLVRNTDREWFPLKYQLLTAICGTALQVKHDKSQVGIFLIHEFITGKTNISRLQKNEEDLRKFLSVLSGQQLPAVYKKLYGPFKIANVECYVGKVTSP